MTSRTTNTRSRSNRAAGALQGTTGSGSSSLLLQGLRSGKPRGSSGERKPGGRRSPFSIGQPPPAACPGEDERVHRDAPQSSPSSTASVRLAGDAAVIGDAGACSCPRAAGELIETGSPDRDSQAVELALVRATIGGFARARDVRAAKRAATNERRRAQYHARKSGGHG